MSSSLPEKVTMTKKNGSFHRLKSHKEKLKFLEKEGKKKTNFDHPKFSHIQKNMGKTQDNTFQLTERDFSLKENTQLFELKWGVKVDTGLKYWGEKTIFFGTIFFATFFQVKKVQCDTRKTGAFSTRDYFASQARHIVRGWLLKVSKMMEEEGKFPAVKRHLPQTFRWREGNFMTRGKFSSRGFK